MNTQILNELIERADSEELIELDRVETAQFFDVREHWGPDVRIYQKKGEALHLPWMATPDRCAYTHERYFINGTEIKPVFDFWGLANCVRGRQYVN